MPPPVAVQNTHVPSRNIGPTALVGNDVLTTGLYLVLHPLPRSAIGGAIGYHYWGTKGLIGGAILGIFALHPILRILRGR